MPVVTTGCSGFAEVVIEVVPPAACAVGVHALNPELCAPWFWLTANPAYKEVAKFAIEKGCDIVVDAGPDYYRVTLREAEKNADTAKRTFKALNTPQGMMWLMRVLSAR